MPSPVRIYAGTQEGLFVWRSQNGSWEKNTVAFESGTIDAVDGSHSQPNIVYLGVTQDGLYRTEDAGKSWRRVFEGMSAPSRWIPPMLSLGDLIFSVPEHATKKFVQ